MPNVEVRDVPKDVSDSLVRMAESAGQSLQQFLLAQLATIAASEPTMDDVFASLDGLDI